MRRAARQALWQAIPLVVAGLLAACTSSAPSAAPSTAQTPTLAEPTAVSASTVVPTATRPAAPSPTRPAPTASPAAAPARPTNRAEVTYRFVHQLSTPEEVDEIAAMLRLTPGIVDVFGDERQITIGYDPALRTPEQIRDQMASVQHPVQ
jgi:cell division septation protein DedD